MKEPPAGLPPANSRNWHSRRWWNQLGYLRVRSLSIPEWQRDSRSLAHVLTAVDRLLVMRQERHLAQVREARRQSSTGRGLSDPA